MVRWAAGTELGNKKSPALKIKANGLGSKGGGGGGGDDCTTVLGGPSSSSFASVCAADAPSCVVVLSVRIMVVVVQSVGVCIALVGAAQLEKAPTAGNQSTKKNRSTLSNNNILHTIVQMTESASIY